VGLKPVWKRLGYWLLYNILFALMPLGISMFFHWLAHHAVRTEIAKSPEVLFFSVMVAITTHGDIVQNGKLIEELLWVGLCRSALLIGAIFSAILYGGLMVDLVFKNGELGFASGVLQTSLYVAAALFLISLFIQVAIGRKEGNVATC